MKKLRIGSRESRLAVRQTELVMEAVHRLHPEIEWELVTMKTTGDIILDKTLDKIGGKGLFVKELDRALLEGRVDLTVHSFKDMPMECDPRLPIVAVSQRADPRDVLVLPKGAKELAPDKPIGCSSARRSVQLKKLFPNTEVEPVRGNVLTRLEKLDQGQYAALVLAYAGLKRLGLEARVSRVFEVDEMLPAACQGVLAVQARQDFDRALLAGFHDEAVWLVSQAERAFVRALDGGCSAPVAAYGVLQGESIRLTGLYVDALQRVHLRSAEGEKENPERLGQSLAAALKKEADCCE